MNFPQNLGDCATVVDQGKKANAILDAEVKERKEKISFNRVAEGVINGLKNSWDVTDPGKYSDSYFFLSFDKWERVVVNSFLLPDANVPPTYKRVDYDEVAQCACPKCKALLPVVEHYVQTFDSPDGDEWLKREIVLCLDCKKIFELDRQVKDHRF